MNTFAMDEPTRAELSNSTGAVMLEFGASWCGYCQAAQPVINTTLALFPGVQHIRVEDGRGRKLGRSFAVKLWPTLVFLKNGTELKRLVREINKDELTASLKLIDVQA